MKLSPNQAIQVAKAPPGKKAALRATYEAQQRGNQKGPASKPAAKAARTRGHASKPGHRSAMRHLMDPMCPLPMPTVTSDGKALPHTGLVSSDFVVGTQNTMLLLVTNVGNAGTVGALLSLTPDGGLAPNHDVQMLTIPTLSQPDTAGGPSAARPMKFSLSVINCTNALKRGGRVTYLHTSQRLPAFVPGDDHWSPTPGADNFSPIVDAIKSANTRRRITGDNLKDPKHLIGYTVDNVNYTSFKPFDGTLSWGAFRTHVLGANENTPTAARGMSIIAYVFDPVAQAQDYSVTIRGAYYTRWPLTSVPGQSMRYMPTADARLINAARDHAETTASELAHVAEGGVIATVAPKAAGALSRVGGWLGRTATGAMQAADGAAVDMLGAEGAAFAEMAIPLL
uniref:Uncharacterized protein n=1 Tax=Barns Ness breadcrumb sponge sobemo-like virus 1 TaxID=2021924 RepID=A0A221LFK2_9VIRU|nr:hypothetical protein [Barns Ness breadcrumb sponge sobemo-like virus 1]